jgi:hypothetical protein
LVGGHHVLRGFLGSAKVPGQRLLGVLVGGNRSGGQVVQLDLHAGPAEHPLRRVCVQGQRPGTAGVVAGGLEAAGLVVDDHQFVATAVDAVDAARQGEYRCAGGDRAFDTHGFVGGIGLGQVGLEPTQGAAERGPLLLAVLIPLADPGGLQQPGQRGRRAPLDGQAVPVLQRGVHARAE